MHYWKKLFEKCFLRVVWKFLKSRYRSGMSQLLTTVPMKTNFEIKLILEKTTSKLVFFLVQLFFFFSLCSFFHFISPLSSTTRSKGGYCIRYTFINKNTNKLNDCTLRLNFKCESCIECWSTFCKCLIYITIILLYLIDLLYEIQELKI